MDGRGPRNKLTEKVSSSRLDEPREREIFINSKLVVPMPGRERVEAKLIRRRERERRQRAEESAEKREARLARRRERDRSRREKMSAAEYETSSQRRRDRWREKVARQRGTRPECIPVCPRRGPRSKPRPVSLSSGKPPSPLIKTMSDSSVEKVNSSEDEVDSSLLESDIRTYVGSGNIYDSSTEKVDSYYAEEVVSGAEEVVSGVEEVNSSVEEGPSSLFQLALDSSVEEVDSSEEEVEQMDLSLEKIPSSLIQTALKVGSQVTQVGSLLPQSSTSTHTVLEPCSIEIRPRSPLHTEVDSVVEKVDSFIEKVDSAIEKGPSVFVQTALDSSPQETHIEAPHQQQLSRGVNQERSSCRQTLIVPFFTVIKEEGSTKDTTPDHSSISQTVFLHVMAGEAFQDKPDILRSFRLNDLTPSSSSS